MSFESLELEVEYRTKKADVVKEFYIPVLEEAISYKRAVGFFRSSALIDLLPFIVEGAVGVYGFVNIQPAGVAFQKCAVIPADDPGCNMNIGIADGTGFFPAEAPHLAAVQGVGADFAAVHNDQLGSVVLGNKSLCLHVQSSFLLSGIV